MAPKAKKPAPTPAPPASRFADRIRDGLGVYLDDPASFPASRIIYFNDDFVAINDLYPKASVHALLLPRSRKHNLLHPFEAFEDPEFLASVQKEVIKLKALVASELRPILNGDAEPDDTGELPPGRDWEADVKIGIHAHPSMNHLHIHVLSRDMHSPCLHHRKHYNSFNTPFLIDVADFPMAKDDPRWHPGHAGYMKRDLVCWRCGANFKNQFKKLNDHLNVEFESWKRE
ncbi:HIT-like domain-containing protein [Plectosphaerella plurivora]|uniref:Aprataxin-like protein n=1 Tax=Plectosphaerella plurivora TaxID=936078 RepID=A0A9P8VAJ5_9PEZI|nr:HIT-like domain-containing protein [Plectosphaerella plurivora]